jgi:hypothetical protein
VSEDTAPTLGGNLTLNGNSLIDVETAEAGNTFAAGEIGYRDASNQIVKASAAAEATAKGDLVMALEAVTGGTTGNFAHTGQVKGLTGGTAGATVYLSTTAGAVTTTAPSGSGEAVRVVGYWLDTTTFNFASSKDWLVLV